MDYLIESLVELESVIVATAPYFEHSIYPSYLFSLIPLFYKYLLEVE